MALDGKKTGDKVAALITTANINGKDDVYTLWENILTAIYDDIKSDIKIQDSNGDISVKVD